MSTTNNHIRDRIQRVTANPPTMDQDVRLVTEGARPFEPCCFFPSAKRTTQKTAAPWATTVQETIHKVSPTDTFKAVSG